MNLKRGISKCWETLKDKTEDDIFEMMDTVCKTPPSFSHNILVGFPINALFIEFMQTKYGRIFFSD
jgi:hypothetical protein